MSRAGIGYNIDKAGELIWNVKNRYKNLGSTIKDAWSPVQNKLHTEWVGPDELSFERVFAEKLCTSYVVANDFVKQVHDVIEAMINDWIEFQETNRLASDLNPSGNRSHSFATVPDADAEIVKAADLSFDDTSMNMGLTSMNSASNIKASISEYVENIKTAVDGMLEPVEEEIKSAFFGNQTTSIQKYIDACHNSMKTVLIAVNDMFTEVDKLAGSRYEAQSTDISQSLDSGVSSVEDAISALGNSRWQG